MLPCIFAKKETRIKITGGTDVAWSPQIDYLREVILPQFRRYADIELNMERRGYYPKGNGKVDIKIKPRFDFEEIGNPKLKFDLISQGKLLQIRGVSHASKDLEKAEVAERQARAAKLGLNKYDIPVKIDSEYCETLSTGSGITLWAVFGLEDDKGSFETDSSYPLIAGADVLGERGKKAEIVGEECAKKLIHEIESNAPVDAHLADNLIPLLGIVGGKFKASAISDHTKTNIYVTEKFLDVKFEVGDNVIKVTKIIGRNNLF